MKQLVLSKSNNYFDEKISTIPNYSLQHIAVSYTYNTNFPILDFILELSKKITLNGVLVIEILDLKLASKHYLSGIINEQDFLSICQSYRNTTMDIAQLIAVLKNREDIYLKNIAQNNYIHNITIERKSL